MKYFAFLVLLLPACRDSNRPASVVQVGDPGGSKAFAEMEAVAKKDRKEREVREKYEEKKKRDEDRQEDRERATAIDQALHDLVAVVSHIRLTGKDPTKKEIDRVAHGYPEPGLSTVGVIPKSYPHLATALDMEWIVLGKFEEKTLWAYPKDWKKQFTVRVVFNGIAQFTTPEQMEKDYLPTLK